MYRPLPLLSFVFLAHAAVAQTPEPATATPTVPAKWDVSAKHGPSRDIEFVTTTGTWISLDVSPDGRTIVFELLGDLYTLPIGGGKATRITSGQAFDTGPRYSPDGQWISFVTDRDGSDNVWVMKADGSSLRQVSSTEWFGYIGPEWSPDGKFIVVARNQGDKYYQPFALYQYLLAGGAGQRI